MKTASIGLSTTARSAIVSSYLEALSSAENTGALVTQVCDVANKYTRGEAISDEDMTSIVGGIAKERGWKGPALKSRASEVRVVLRASNTLPEAIKAFRNRADKCDWHTSMKLARCINKGTGVQKAVSQVFAAAKSGGQSAKSNPAGRAAGALKAWWKAAKGEKKAAILRAAEILGLKLNVKVEH